MLLLLLQTVCPGLNANEIQIPYDKHHEVSALVKSDQNRHNPAIYEVISKKYLRSILDISVLLLLLPLPLPLPLLLLLLLLCDIKWKHFVWLAPYHVALERFLPVLTKTVKDAEYHDLIVHGLTCHPLVWRESKHVTLSTLCLPYTCTSRTYTLRRDWVWVIQTLSFPWFQCKKTYCAVFCASPVALLVGSSNDTSCHGLQWLERVADCTKTREDVVRPLIYLISSWASMKFFRHFTVKKTRLPCLLKGSLAYIFSGLLINKQYAKRWNRELTLKCKFKC